MFDKSPNYIPLAARLRPNALQEMVGQAHLLGKGKLILHMVQQKQLHSMIFWGPPGTGKTSLAYALSEELGLMMVRLSAVTAGVADIRQAVHPGQTTILFLDEIHRLNKSQQDVLLPYVESGELVLIGATTENPSFAINRALLSRVQIFIFHPLSNEDLLKLLKRGLVKENQSSKESLTIDDNALELLVNASSGDARRCLNLLETTLQAMRVHKLQSMDVETLASLLPEQMVTFDKKDEHFYNQISALHKSIRGSDPDASLYWFARMLTGGCPPEYIARRVLRAASEDIGNADPRALTIALDAWQTYERLGSPEGELALAQAIIYLACCPKSNAIYKAYNKVSADMKQFGDMDVPLHLRNAPTKLMKQLNYGKAYQYPHDSPTAYIPNIHYFPDEMPKRSYYIPTNRGLEKQIKEKLAELYKLNETTKTK